MSRNIRVSAKTVEEAITEAIIQLEVTSDRLDYEVIEKGSQGFLGIGMKQAVIEAKVKEDRVIEDKVKEEKGFLAEKKKMEDFEPRIDEKGPKKDKGKHQKKKATKHDDTKKEAKEGQASHKEIMEEKKDVEKETTLSKKEDDFEITDITKEAVESFLKGTLEAMGMEVELSVSVDKDNILCVDLAGENMGILIGKRGQTLDSLQYLANRVANKHQAEYVRVKLDTENYRERREETLTRLAKNLAQKVRKTRRPVHLEPMNPYERRIIHSVLQSNPYVVTHSEGDEPYRKVVIVLKR